MQDVILKIRLEQYYFLKRNKLKTEKSADADQKEKKKKEQKCELKQHICKSFIKKNNQREIEEKLFRRCSHQT